MSALAEGGGLLGACGESSSAPILAYADFSKPFLAYTDARLRVLGAVLSKVRVIAYARPSLSPLERNDQNYSSFKPCMGSD